MLNLIMQYSRSIILFILIAPLPFSCLNFGAGCGNIPDSVYGTLDEINYLYGERIEMDSIKLNHLNIYLTFDVEAISLSSGFIFSSNASCALNYNLVDRINTFQVISNQSLNESIPKGTDISEYFILEEFIEKKGRVGVVQIIANERFGEVAKGNYSFTVNVETEKGREFSDRLIVPNLYN
jgi:hypothetical protein